MEVSILTKRATTISSSDNNKEAAPTTLAGPQSTSLAARTRTRLKNSLTQCAATSRGLFQRRRRQRRRPSNAVLDDDDDGTVLVLPETTLPPATQQQQALISSTNKISSNDNPTDSNADDAPMLPFSFLCGPCQPTTTHHQGIAAAGNDDDDDDEALPRLDHDDEPRIEQPQQVLLEKDDPTIQESIECVFRRQHQRTMSSEGVGISGSDEQASSHRPEQAPAIIRPSRLFRYSSHSQADMIQSQMELAASPRECMAHGAAAAASSPSNSSNMPVSYPLVAPSSSFRARHDNPPLLLAESQAYNLMHNLHKQQQQLPMDPEDEADHDDMAGGLDSSTPNQLLRVGDLILDGTVQPTRSRENSHAAGSSASALLDDSTFAQSTALPVSASAPAPACDTPQQSSFLSSSSGSSLPLALHDAKSWPQYPILLRPNSQTRVIGIRYSDSNSLNDTNNAGNDVNSERNKNKQKYLWTPDSQQSWLQLLHQDWSDSHQSKHVGFEKVSTTTTQRQETPTTTNTGSHDNEASACNFTLPVNNGNEPLGRALVTDFESDYFKGTLLIRIRHTEGTTSQAYDDSQGYFHGVNRRYQAVIRGQFKTALPWSDLMTGFHLDKPCGRLPPKFIVKSTLKVVSFFAPQLQAQVSGQNPHVLTPLGSAPQCIILHDDVTASELDNDTNFNNSIGLIDGQLTEPTLEEHTLLGEACSNPSSMSRARFRKKNFDRLYAATKGNSDSSSSDQPPAFMTDPSKVYTFEFLQHLFDFESFSIELGSVLGSIPLAPIMHGQPLQVMACDSKINYLWCFELWHAELMNDVKKQCADKHDEGTIALSEECMRHM